MAKPYQLAFAPRSTIRLGKTAGTHSIVWILAMTAALIRRATLYSRSSSQSG